MEFEERPWGRFDVLSDEADSKVKRIKVSPGKRFSYQRHSKRKEYWLIVSGTAEVTLEDVNKQYLPGDVVVIDFGEKHRIKCTSDDPLIFIEVQMGTYFGEDDEERFEDDFGRI